MADGDVYLPVITREGRSSLLNESRVFQEALEMLQVRLAQDFLNLWAYSENMPYGKQVRYLTEALAELHAVYGDDATGLAAQYLEVMRGGADLPVVFADPVESERLGVSVRWALSNPEAQTLLYGAMQRYMREPYRETIRLSAFAAGNGYARVPDPDACPFCLMLASRGAVYSSKREALEVGLGKYSRTSRASREIKARAKGKKPDYGYHDYCKCDVVEVSESVGLPEANVLLWDMWQTEFHGEDGRSNPHGLKSVTFGSAFGIWEKKIKDEGLPWMSTDPIVPK